MIAQRIRKLDNVQEQWLGHFDLDLPIDTDWSSIPPQTLRAGESIDLKRWAGDISRINFAPGVSAPSYITLSNGIISVASSGLPSTNATTRLSFIGIGSGEPAYISFPLTVLRQPPSWETI